MRSASPSPSPFASREVSRSRVSRSAFYELQGHPEQKMESSISLSVDVLDEVSPSQSCVEKQSIFLPPPSRSPSPSRNEENQMVLIQGKMVHPGSPAAIVGNLYS
jgi:hypothetical protein